MQSIVRKFWWGLAATWAVIIFNLSGASCSAASSARLISSILNWLSISVLPQNLDRMNFLLRKTAHLSEYAIFAMILYHSIKPSGAQSWSRKSAFFALLASGIYSLTDEFHQMFVAGRHASLYDCLLDTTGAFLGLLVLSSVILAVRRGVMAQTAQAFGNPELPPG